jgi:flagellar biosynthesis/type III secretory pathway protein FliH
MILEIVRDALGHLADKQKVTIRVNPADAEALRNHSSEWAEATGAGSTVEIAEDMRIKRGGCLIEGESGSVEAQLDRQIEMIEKALMEAVHAG